MLTCVRLPVIGEVYAIKNVLVPAGATVIPKPLVAAEPSLSRYTVFLGFAFLMLKSFSGMAFP